MNAWVVFVDALRITPRVIAERRWFYVLLLMAAAAGASILMLTGRWLSFGGLFVAVGAWICQFTTLASALRLHDSRYRMTFSVVLYVLLISVLYLLAIVLGLAVLILPGICLGIRFYFAPLLAACEGWWGDGDPFTLSWKLTQAAFWQVAWLAVLQIFLSLIALPLDHAVDMLNMRSMWLNIPVSVVVLAVDIFISAAYATMCLRAVEQLHVKQQFSEDTRSLPTPAT